MLARAIYIINEMHEIAISDFILQEKTQENVLILTI